MNENFQSGEIPDATSRRKWCEKQPEMANDPTFLTQFLLQLNSAAFQLNVLAESLGKSPLSLTLDDLIQESTLRYQHYQSLSNKDND